MHTSEFRYGFRVTGGRNADRLLIDWQSAFDAHLQDDERAASDRESYLSAFQFGPDFRDYLQHRGTSKGFSGPTWSRWLWFDIDRPADQLGAALADTRKLADTICQRWGRMPDDLAVFFSGSKGFHVGVPTALWQPTPAEDYHSVCRHFAECLAGLAGVQIDTGVYDRVRLFRAPNSRHQRTGLHKRYLDAEEFYRIAPEGILDAARHPEECTLPDTPEAVTAAVRDWQDAVQNAHLTDTALQDVRHRGTLNKLTLAFIREGADSGDRHRLLYSAAANLAEFDCPAALAHELLTPSARDSGLTPSDTRRQIECGLQDGGRRNA